MNKTQMKSHTREELRAYVERVHGPDWNAESEAIWTEIQERLLAEYRYIQAQSIEEVK